MNKSIKTFLILGIVIMVVFIANALVRSTASDDSAGGMSGLFSGSGGQQGVTPIDDHDHDDLDDHDHDDEPFVLPDTPAGTEVTRVPGTGLVTQIIADQPTAAFQSVLDQIFLDIYDVYECRDLGATERAVLLTAKPGDVSQRDQFMATRMAIEAWEPFIPRDLGETLWPTAAVGSFDQVSAQFTSASLDARVAQFQAGSQSYELYYGWILNFVVFATSENCLTASINDMYAPHSH